MIKLMIRVAAILAIPMMVPNLGRAEEDGHHILGGPRLAIGDLAPPLQVQEFVRGQPVSQLKLGTTYVLEFWKTGCPPCRAAIPHLNELQQKYPAAVFISVGIYTSTPDNIAYVQRSGDQMQYRVAVDRVPPGKDPYTAGAMVQGWLEPAEQSGVPVSFIVGPDGRIAWIGHPLDLDNAKSGSPLDKVITGRFDNKIAAAKYADSSKVDGKACLERLPRTERQALEVIQANVGRVAFDVKENRVTGIELDSARLNDEMLAELAGPLQKLDGLKQLRLNNAAIGDEGVKALGKLKQLTMLDLGCTQVSDRGLIHLRELHDLWVLDLKGTRVTGTGLNDLRSLAKLETLDLSGTPLSAAGMKALRRFPELHVLNLADSGVSDGLLGELKGMTQLRGLELSRNPITDQGLQALSGLTLGNLALAGTRVTGPGLAHIKDLVGALKLSGTPTSDAGLPELKRFSHLHRLMLDGTQVTDTTLEYLAGHRGLRSLSLTDTKVTDKGIGRLRDALELEALELAGTQVTDGVFSELTRYPSLSFLDLARTKVSKAATKRFQSCRADLMIAQ